MLWHHLHTRPSTIHSSIHPHMSAHRSHCAALHCPQSTSRGRQSRPNQIQSCTSPPHASPSPRLPTQTNPSQRSPTQQPGRPGQINTSPHAVSLPKRRPPAPTAAVVTS
ncbi:hypothetical protein BKA80DRAFT_139126 [Phyllosticta citrichinensis]